MVVLICFSWQKNFQGYEIVVKVQKLISMVFDILIAFHVFARSKATSHENAIYLSSVNEKCTCMNIKSRKKLTSCFQSKPVRATHSKIAPCRYYYS